MKMLFLKPTMKMVGKLVMKLLCWKEKVIHYFQYTRKMNLVVTSKSVLTMMNITLLKLVHIKNLN